MQEGDVADGKKIYHIVDPKTGQLVGEKRCGPLERFLLFAASGEGKAALWIAFGGFVFLCLLFSALEPSLPRLPSWSFSVARDIPFCAAVLLLMRLILNAGRLFKPREPKSDNRHYYRIVDPGTGKVVGNERLPSSEGAAFSRSPKEKTTTALFGINIVCLFLSFVFLVLAAICPGDFSMILLIAYIVSFLACIVFMFLFGAVSKRAKKPKEDGE